ncbi:hypothetical protein MN0502_06970 [Arthrobacter sp. MN05-02]|nr:hypothetical protein MN0502_06970 [Arthrobacter sp. MN05-02]
MEHHLTQQAIESDEDILRVLARRWEDTLDQDGSEPSDKVLHARQGVFLKGRRHGLHVLEIGATDEQYEHLATVMNTTTNPRALQGQNDDAQAAGSTGAADGTRPGGRSGPNASSGADSDADPGADPGAGFHGRHDGPTRAQFLLDGLVTACKIALTTTGLPATGGHRPQVMVTIDYKDLIGDIQHANRPGNAGNSGQAGHAGHAGYGVFIEQLSARTIRTLACDADLIPLVLGSSGQVLDIGRAQRLFPPHLRRALVARDKGCAFPDCTIPASWCEAHHITPWSRDGRTSINNGVLLCTRHHHVIHQGTWTVEPRHGIPWFHAPGNSGRAGTPRQNTYRQAGRTIHDKRPDRTASYTHTDPD